MRYTGAQARALLLAVEPGTPTLERAAALVSLRLAARDLAATVEALEAERDEARRSLARIYQTLGFDCDGNDPETGWWHLYDKAEGAAREHRAEADAEGRRLEADLAEARLCLLAEAGDPMGSEGLHPGWVHCPGGWMLTTTGRLSDGLALLARARPDERGPTSLRWMRTLSAGNRGELVPAGLTIRDAMRWVEREVGL